MGIVSFSPKQDGTGDPSSTNVRPIHPGLTIDGIGDIYGGYVNFDTGELAEEYQLIQFDGTEAIVRTAREEIRRYTSFLEDKTGVQVYGSRSSAKCSHCMLVNGSTGGTYDTLRYANSESRGYLATYVALNDAYDEQFGGSATNVLEWFKSQADNGTPFQLLVGRVDSVTYSLTSSQLTQAYNQLVPVSPIMLARRRRIMLTS